MTIKRLSYFSRENHHEMIPSTAPHVAIASVDEFNELLGLAEQGNEREFRVVSAAGDFQEKDPIILEGNGRQLLAEVRKNTEAGPEIRVVRVLNGKH
jgi:hypothetical protein